MKMTGENRFTHLPRANVCRARRFAGLLIGVLIIMGVSVVTGGGRAHAHVGGPMVVPKMLSVPAGKILGLKCTGFEGVEVVEVKLKGVSAEVELGQFEVDGEDFELEVRIPEWLAPGSYKVIVAGDGARAEKVITVLAVAGEMSHAGGTGEMGEMGQMGTGTHEQINGSKTEQENANIGDESESVAEKQARVDELQMGKEDYEGERPHQIGAEKQAKGATGGQAYGVEVELNISRPGWLTALVLVVALISVSGGIWLLRRV